MGKHVLMSAALRHVGTPVLLLLLLLLRVTHTSQELVTSTTVRSLDELSSPYSSIFSPLLKALSEHGGPRWSPALRKKMKPEHRYMTFLSQVYKRSSRVQRSLDGNKNYNTVRLIKPKDECLAQGDKVSYMQDLSFSLGHVRRKEQLLKSALLYHLDDDHHAAPLDTICYMSVRKQEQPDQCHLCPVIHHAVNFTADRRNRKNWVEVDITPLVKPLLKFQKKNIQLLVNVTCPDKHVVKEVTLKPPPLLLYLNDASKTIQSPMVGEKPGAGTSAAAKSFHKQIVFKPKQKFRHKRRWKRHALKSKRGDRSFDIHLPDLRSPSEFPTSDCALYDFRVRFSQLKLDHWIVFPPKYNPRYCRGICPKTLGFIYGSPVHTMVQNIIYEKLDSSVPQPSCIPSHYSPLSVMIFEEDGSYVYKEFEDMVATRCTCR